MRSASVNIDRPEDVLSSVLKIRVWPPCLISQGISETYFDKVHFQGVPSNSVIKFPEPIPTKIRSCGKNLMTECFRVYQRPVNQVISFSELAEKLDN